MERCTLREREVLFAPTCDARWSYFPIRECPDYRNSIKESISAVESLVATVVGEKGTLGQLIKKLEDEISLHPALRTAFGSLYGYTSDEGGIRHAILESKDLSF